MKHRAETKHRFRTAAVAAALVAAAGGGTAVLAGGSGHDGPLPAAAISPAIRNAQVLAALRHRPQPPAPQHGHKHKSKHKPKRGHGRSSPSPVPTSPGTSPGSTRPPAGPAGPKSWAWCSSDSFGTFNTSDGFDLYNNKWNSSGHPGPQQICGNSGHDWQVTSTQRAGNTAVLTYPSVQRNYPNRALSSFTSMMSSYAENMNAVAGTDAEAAYDIWINDLSKEVNFTLASS